MAKELIDIASTAGADFVKFQTFKAKRLVTRKAEKANYQIVQLFAFISPHHFNSFILEGSVLKFV